MKSVIGKIFSGESDEEVHQQLIRYGKGNYGRRFLISLNKGKKIKIRGSFEWANDFVNFVKENKDVKYSGRVLMRKKVEGLDGKKKAGSFVYEISESSLEQFEDAFFYLLNVNEPDIVLKIKKKLPKPGKNEDKIDDKFCSLDLDLKHWDKVKEIFFWDVPECKKALIEHEFDIQEIILPQGVDDPVEMRRLAKKKGILKRKIIIGEKEDIKEKAFEV
ncbi:MAG: hypothetical protein ABIH92_02605 [Nanoarchaeota archaeon]